MEDIYNYSCSDICAMADARNSSYGKIHAALENGYKLPPLVRDTRWPRGSEHKGEDRLGNDSIVHFFFKRDVPPAPVRKAEEDDDLGAYEVVESHRRYYCTRCRNLTQGDETRWIRAHSPGRTNKYTGSPIAVICPDCDLETLPQRSPDKFVIGCARINKDGKQARPNTLAKCAECGLIVFKNDCKTIYSHMSNSPAKLRAYVCNDCMQAFADRLCK